MFEIIKSYSRENAKKIEMQKALDHAWENASAEEKQRQNELFPEGKPSLENFIKTMAEQVKPN